jgi:hypothetical protein
MSIKPSQLLAPLAGLLLTATMSAQAVSNHTWVSGFGNDANTGTFISPYATFATAVANTTAGGIVSVRDAGDFGAVTISKSITLDGSGAGATITFTGAEGVFVSAGATDKVILRHLTINGIGMGTDAIFFSSGATLVVEDSTLSGFTDIGLGVGSSAAQNIVVKNATITGGTLGLRVFQGVGPVQISMNNVTISGASSAAVFVRSGVTDINNSVITQSAIGLENDTNSTINAENCVLSYNSTAVEAFTSSTIRLSNNNIYNNGTAIGAAGGTVATAGDNKNAGNTNNATRPNSTITIE